MFAFQAPVMTSSIVVPREETEGDEKEPHLKTLLDLLFV